MRNSNSPTFTFSVTSLARDTLILAFGSSLSKYLSVLLIPIYSRFISPADYGVLSLIAIVGLILNALCTLALTNGISRYIYFSDDEKVTKESVIWSPLILVFFNSLIILGIIVFFHEFFSFQVFGSEKYHSIFLIVIVTIFFTNFNSIGISILVFEKKVKKVVTLNLLTVLLQGGLGIYFVVFLNKGLEGIIEAALISSIIIFFTTYYLSISNYKIEFNLSILKKQVKFSLPLLIAIIAFFFINSSDRYFLNLYLPLSEVGLYNIGYQGALFILILVDGFSSAWPPFYYSNNQNGDAQRLCYPVLLIFSFAAFIFILFISLFAPFVLKFLTPIEYHQAYTVVPFVAFAYALKGPYIIFLMGLLMKNKTFIQLILECIAAVINVLLNIYFINLIGREGAAISTLICYGFLSLSTFLAVQHINKIHKFNISRILFMTFVIFLISCSSLFNENINNYEILSILIFLGLSFYFSFNIWKIIKGFERYV